MPPECAGLRLDQALARLLPEHSRNRLQQWVRDGFVQVDGRPAAPKSRVWGGETLAVDIRPAVQSHSFEPEAIALSIVYEDDSIIAVDKPSGLPTMPAGGFLNHTLLSLMRDQYPEASPLHRLGRYTSGLVLFARSHAAFASRMATSLARTGWGRIGMPHATQCRARSGFRA